jgi:pimeloyl-ACP methyl ester carboxylesterase
MDQRNANSGLSTGPVSVDNPWDAFADDQLGLMDHLGIREFFYMGYCIGGCFAGKLLQRAPDRVVAAVFCQTVGHWPEDPSGGGDVRECGMTASGERLVVSVLKRYSIHLVGRCQNRTRTSLMILCANQGPSRRAG